MLDIPELSAVILAAGKGTRLKSDLPKVLHPVGGVPMVQWAVQNAARLGADRIALVVGVGADQVRSVVGDSVQYAVQADRLGTGHAALQARELLQGAAHDAAVLVLYGDMPTIRYETLERLVELHRQRRPGVTLLSVLSEDSMGFGRVVRDVKGCVQAIVEEAVATPEILALKELNCGVYCFEAEWLWRRLPDVPVTMPKGEYYLTDMVGLAVEDGLAVEVLAIEDVDEVQGVNNRVQLACSERIIRERILTDLMLSGVTIEDPASTYVQATVQVGRDTVIYANTYLRGQTVVGERCELGPNSIIRDSQIGNGCRVFSSVVEEAVLEDSVEMGPFGHLRKGAHLASGVHMGNFGEVKNSYLAPGVKMGHFSYLGDAQVDEGVNIGAGTITCNYDGNTKHRTHIGAGAFVGSGTMLVAPVNVGPGAKIGAGSVVTHDVPAGTLVYGAPARVQSSGDKPEQDHE